MKSKVLIKTGVQEVFHTTCEVEYNLGIIDSTIVSYTIVSMSDDDLANLYVNLGAYLSEKKTHTPNQT